jgi:hypothetical protein
MTWDRLAADRKRLRKAQLEALRENCREAARTEFGRAHRLGEVSTHEDFIERVPLRTYADFEPFLERMRKGARDVLWPGLIRFYGQSSGARRRSPSTSSCPSPSGRSDGNRRRPSTSWPAT